MRIALPTLVLAAAILLAGCDLIKRPGDPDAKKPISDRVVLLTEFTGHGCGRCPRAHEEALALEAFYDTCVVMVSIHSGFFSDASGIFFGDSFLADYKIPWGEGLDDHYQADEKGFPKGLVNQVKLNGDSLFEFTEWRSRIYDELLREHKVGMSIETEYDAAGREATIDVWMEYQAPGTANDHLVVLITEDSVVSAQKDYDYGDQFQYVHRHVLRASVTQNQWGEPLGSTAPAQSELLKRSFRFTLDPAWDAEKCHVVAYVMHGPSKYIYQAAETYVVHD